MRLFHKTINNSVGGGTGNDPQGMSLAFGTPTELFQMEVPMGTAAVLLDLGFVEHEGQFVISAEALGVKLGYTEPRKHVNKLYHRHADEISLFKVDVNLTTVNGCREAVHFSELGAYILAMHANTPKAKEFRMAIAKHLQGFRKLVNKGEFSFPLGATDYRPRFYGPSFYSPSQIQTEHPFSVSIQKHIELLEFKCATLEKEIDSLRQPLRRNFTEAEISEAVEMNAHGFKICDIAKKLDRSPDSIRTLFYRLKKTISAQH